VIVDETAENSEVAVEMEKGLVCGVKRVTSLDNVVGDTNEESEEEDAEDV